jgi:hypothetical protein
MTTYRVSEIEGYVLDAAVAKAEQRTDVEIGGWGPWIDDGSVSGHGNNGRPYRPSQDWRDGGPIIEREKIAIYHYGNPDLWCAGYELQAGDGPGIYKDHDGFGPTPLIASMRAYVTKCFGEYVDLEV